ncbi:hypothetical protein ABD76_25750 [Paenibacillus dendritiformis]|nr:hypothetical protein [Paenibacillus dendritiformis]
MLFTGEVNSSESLKRNLNKWLFYSLSCGFIFFLFFVQASLPFAHIPKRTAKPARADNITENPHGLTATTMDENGDL